MWAWPSTYRSPCSRSFPGMGKEVTVYTYFQVREDAMTLYGFLHSQDRDMFRQLLGVNGIGPKGALGILSVLRPDDLRLAIVSEDVKALAKAPGIGNKTAQRLILDLKDKISMDDVLGNMAGGAVMGAADTGASVAGLVEAAKEGGPGTGSSWLHQHRGIQGSEAGGGYGRNDFGGCAEGVPASICPSCRDSGKREIGICRGVNGTQDYNNRSDGGRRAHRDHAPTPMSQGLCGAGED